MAGAGLIGIKRRIKSVGNIQKITKAMGLVATAKLRKSRQKLEVTIKYTNAINDTIKKVIECYDGSSVYFKGNGSIKKLYVIFASDSGLCGGFNAAVVSEAIQEIEKDKQNSSIVVVGQKGKLYLKKYKYEPIKEFIQMPELAEISDMKDIGEYILEAYNNSEFGEINFVYTKFISTVKRVVEINKLLPLKSNQKNFYPKYVEFEPDIEMVLNNLVKIYTNTQLLNAMVSSKTSEQSARMTAMDSATKNANDLLDNLKLQFNRVRQSIITQELSEIVGGAEAQK